MSSPSERITAAFGVPYLPYALFYEFPYGLRFELGGEINHFDEPVRRLLQSMDRAREVSRRLFSESPSVSAVISHYGPRRIRGGEARGLRDLRKLGFRPESFGERESRAENDEDYIAEFGEDLYRHWYCIDLASPPDDIDVLLWAAITAEMPIQPSVRGLSTIQLVDFKRRIALHVYDDRGMDVIATEPEALAPLYRDYNAWLIDYDHDDRERMDATFKPLIATVSG